MIRRLVAVQPKFLAALLILLSSLSIVFTYTRLSHTSDEPAHLSTGMQWWDEHRFTYEPLHPPLARLMAAGLPHASGVSLAGSPYDMQKHESLWYAGLDLLGHMPGYTHRLFLMRLGVLPFYILSCLLVYRWSKRLYGEQSALASLALFASLPTVLAHAGLATTDMAGAALLMAGVMASLRWLKTPNLANALITGAVLALMAGAKFSNLFFWPAIMVALLLTNIAASHMGRLPAFSITRWHFAFAPLVAACFGAVLGALYFFDYTPFIDGIQSLLSKNRIGHAIYLFKKLNNVGVWYFFPVLYFFKTPLLFLLGNVLSLKQPAQRGEAAERLFPIIAAAVVFLVSMPSNINLGVRHVLPVYLFMAVPSGHALLLFWRRGKNMALVAIALFALYLVGELAVYYPDRIAYYNLPAQALTWGHPERIAYDSDFDWGQQYFELRDAVERHGIAELYTCLRLGGFLRNMPETLGIRPQGCPSGPVRGWIAAGRATFVISPDKMAWLQAYRPVEKLGPTLYLYHIE